MRPSVRHLSLVVLLLAAACGGMAPPSSRVGGHLAPCPPTPHCVSTDASEPDGRRMATILFAGTPAAAYQRILAAVLAEPRAYVVVDSAPYLRFAVPTRVFRFVDDVELLVDSVAHRIEFRSSARLGVNDFGVNRARMERVGVRLRR